MRLLYGAATHQGHARENNEDAHLAQLGLPAGRQRFDPEGSSGDGRLFAVADGMGGPPAGEIASHLALRTLQRCYEASRPQYPATTILHACFGAAHKALILSAETYPARRGMGTTLIALAVRNGIAFLAHAGDSRCYLVRGTDRRALTRDHAAGNGALTNCLGSRESAFTGADVSEIRLRLGDVFVLCSDGLSRYFDAEAVGAIVAGPSGHPEWAANALVRRALEAGGADNVTAVVVEVVA